MTQTLDQQRARFAWEAVNQARRAVPKFDDYKNLAKGAPALIMGNGLMAAVAFYESRKKKDITVLHAAALRDTILAWLVTRFKEEQAFQPLPKDFRSAMERLQQVDSGFYMRATDETLAMLKWLRQFADAVSASDAGQTT
jgi:CRISPR-associated protein Cmr5